MGFDLQLQPASPPPLPVSKVPTPSKTSKLHTHTPNTNTLQQQNLHSSTPLPCPPQLCVPLLFRSSFSSLRSRETTHSTTTTHQLPSRPAPTPCRAMHSWSLKQSYKQGVASDALSQVVSPQLNLWLLGIGVPGLQMCSPEEILTFLNHEILFGEQGRNCCWGGFVLSH